MHWKDRYTFIVFVLFGLKYISYVEGASSLSQSSYTVKGFPGSLQCTVTPLSSSVEFQKNSVFKGQCFVPGDPASCTTSVSQSGETTYFNITSLSYTEHDGVWTCVNYLGDKDTNLTVYSPFGDTSITSTKTKLLSGESTQLTCRMKCQYPINSGFSSIEIWKNDGKIKSLTSYTATTPSASDGCEAHEQNLDAVFTIFSTDACGNDKLYCKFHHDVLGTNTNNSLSLEFPSSADCVISTSDSPSITDQSTNMHATEQSSLANTGDVVSTTVKFTTLPPTTKPLLSEDQSTNMHATEQSSLANTGDVVSTTVKSTTVPPTTKPLLSEEEVLILAVGLSVGVFTVIIIIIIVVFLFRSDKKGQTNKKHYKDKNNRSTRKQRADENELKHTKYHGEGISHKKQHHSDVGHHTSTSAKSFPQRSNKHNYNYYQPQILHGHNYGFQEGQSPYTEDNWEGFDYYYDNRAYSGSKAHGRYPHDNDHHGYTRNQSYPDRYPHDNDRHGYTRNQSYPNRSELNLYPSLHQSYTYY